MLYPIKNTRYTVHLPFFTSAGAQTDPTSPDTEFSLDGGSAADCAEEITVTGGGNGWGYITLTGAENNGQLEGTSKSSNCLNSPFYATAAALAILTSGTITAGAAGGGTLTPTGYDITGCFIRTTGGTGGGGTGGANNQGRMIDGYTNSTGAFTIPVAWETTVGTSSTYDILLPIGVTKGMLKALNPATDGRTLFVDSNGLTGLSSTQSGVTFSSLVVTTGTLSLASAAVGNLSMTSFSNSGTSNTTGLTTLAGFSTGAMTITNLVTSGGTLNLGSVAWTTLTLTNFIVGAGTITLNGGIAANITGGLSGTTGAASNVLLLNGTEPHAAILAAVNMQTTGTMNTVQTASTVTGAVTVDWSLITNPTASKAFTGTTISSNQSVSQATLVLTTQTASTVTGAVTVDWSLITNATATKAFTGSTISSNQSVSQATLVLTTQTTNTFAAGAITSASFAASATSQTFGVTSTGATTVRDAVFQGLVAGAGTVSGSAAATWLAAGAVGATSFNATQVQQITDAALSAPTNPTSSATTSLYAIAEVGSLAAVFGTNVTVTPVTSTVSAGEVVSDDFITYQNAAQTFTFAIVDGDGAPIDLSGKTVRFTASVGNDFTSPVITHDNASIGGLTVTGADHNSVVLVLTSTDTATAPQFLVYGIFNVTNDLPLAAGDMTILEISQKV